MPFSPAPTIAIDGIFVDFCCVGTILEKSEKRKRVKKKNIGQIGIDESDMECSTLDRLKQLFTLAIPIVGGFWILFLGSFINVLFASHYGYEDTNSAVFAGVSLANLFANITFFSFIIGMSSAVETLASQNFGAKNYEEVGLTVQRSILILTAMSLPLATACLFAGKIFSYFGIEAAVVTVITNYLHIRMLALPLDIVNVSFEKYLMAVGVTTPSLIANTIQNVTLILFNTVFVFGLNLGYHWLAVSWVSSTFVMCIVQVGMSWNYPEVQLTLIPWDRRAVLTGWKQFIALGIPGALMSCSECWAFEINLFFASQLGTTSVTVQAIMTQILTLTGSIPLGISIATASLVGNAIGAGKRKHAIELSRLALVVIFCAEVVVGLILFCGGGSFIHFFTKNDSVKEIFMSMLPFLSVVTIIDGFQTVSSGILRGTGNQAIGAAANIFSFYGIGIPVAWYLCFRTPLRVRGLFYGLYCGASFQATVLLSLVLCCQSYVFNTTVLKEGIAGSRNGDSNLSVTDLEEQQVARK